MRAKKKKKSAQPVTQRGKTKATKEDQLQKWRIQWGVFIYYRRQPLNIYRSGLCFVLRAVNTQTDRFSSSSTLCLLVTGGLKGFCDLVIAQILCNIHIWPPIVSDPTNSQNCLFSIVLNVIFFPPFLFSWPFFQHPCAVLRRELRREPPTVPKWRPLLVNPSVQETALDSPPNISPPNNGVLLRVCHIIEGTQVDLEPGPAQDMHTYSYTCGLHSWDTPLSFGNTNR